MHVLEILLHIVTVLLDCRLFTLYMTVRFT